MFREMFRQGPERNTAGFNSSVPLRPSLHAAIIGYGTAGRFFHAPLIAATQGIEIGTIVTSQAERVAQARIDHPHARIMTTVDELFESISRDGAADHVDLIVIAAPNEHHVPLALRCIDAGIAVVVDKPLASSVSDALLLIERAEQAGVLMSVFQNRRWDNDFLTLSHLLGKDRLGEIIRFESRFERWRPELKHQSWKEDPQSGAGLLNDLGSHLIDQALVLFGPVSSLYAELDQSRSKSAVDDDVFIAMTHSSGVRSHLWASAMAAQHGPRFRVLGKKAAFSKYGLDLQESQLRSGLRPGAPLWGIGEVIQVGTVGTPDASEEIPMLGGCYEQFYEAMLSAIAENGPLPVEPSDSISVLQIIEAARLSAASAAVVTLG